jgi:hypothetical protein
MLVVVIVGRLVLLLLLLLHCCSAVLLDVFFCFVVADGHPAEQKGKEVVPDGRTDALLLTQRVSCHVKKLVTGTPINGVTPIPMGSVRDPMQVGLMMSLHHGESTM